MTCCASRASCARRPAGCSCRACASIVQSPEIVPEQPDGEGREDNTIVVIGRGYQGDDLRKSLRYFAGQR